MRAARLGAVRPQPCSSSARAAIKPREATWARGLFKVEIPVYDHIVGMDLAAEPVELPVRRRAIAAAVVAMRPHQWTKNLLLFGGIIFAAKLGDAVRWAEVIGAFAAYCAASSAAYLVNDVRDREADR